MRGGPRRSLIRGLAAALLVALTGCGFALRQPPDFAFKSVYAQVAPTSALGMELRRQLNATGNVELITDTARLQEAQVVLAIVAEERGKTVVGVSTTGQVREFQLRMTLKFRLSTPQGREVIPETELSQLRTLSFDEAFALAKETEEAMLYRNMQNDIVQQILRRLAAVKSL